VTRRTEDGFTLPELLVAIIILGIIMIAIGAMITTSFQTSRTVSTQLQGSRAPKMVSRYWIPDAEQASGPIDGGGCGGGTHVATFTSPSYASAFDDRTPGPSVARTIDWTIVPRGSRFQLVRTVCGATPARTVVVSDLGQPLNATNASKSTPPRYVLTVAVPDSDRSDGFHTFDVAGSSQVDPESAP